MVPVPERYISTIKLDDAAHVNFDALPERIFEGVIKAIIPRASEATRTFPVRIEIPNPETIIRAGMFGRVSLPVGNPHNAILVPKDAVVLSSRGEFLYIVNDQVAHMVPVKMGAAHGSLVEVAGDVSPGSMVVVRGNERLRPGQPVRIVPAMGSK
jgi:RND family efflux transporter MFP subunit